MFRSGEQRCKSPGRIQGPVGTAIFAAVLIAANGFALAEDAPASPPSPQAPHSGGSAPGNGAQPGGNPEGQQQAPGTGERDGATEPEAPLGCPYRDRPLNLLV